MNTLKTQWGRAGSRLARLSATQKLIASVLLAVMIATAFYLSAHNVKTAMEPVLDQAFADADVVQIHEHLTAHGVPHEMRDGKVYVPADRKLDVLSDLIYTDLLTGNTESGFDALIKQSSIWDTPSKADKMFNRAREVTLERLIGRFHGVRKATVIIDPTSERHISGSITPSALVDMQTRGDRSGGDGANPRQLANAAINAVTGAVSTMERQKVKVTIDGASYNTGGPITDGDQVAGDLLERRQQCEQVYVSKVRQQLKFIPDVLVSVSVDLNLQSQEEEKHTFDPQNTVQSKIREQTRNEERDTAVADAMGPMANAVPELPEKIAVARPAARTEDTTTEYSVQTSETILKNRTPAGKETVLSASVAVPRSYFVNIYQRASKKPSVDPDDALLQTVVDVHLPRIRNLVRTTLGLKNEDVSVEVFDDATPAAFPAAPASASALVTAKTPTQASVISMSSIALLTAHWREASYAAAGIATLLIGSTVLRRGNDTSVGSRDAMRHTPQLAAVAAPPRRVRRPAPVIASVEDEMDDETRGLLRQVRELASREPEEAARILRDWIEED